VTRSGLRPGGRSTCSRRGAVGTQPVVGEGTYEHTRCYPRPNPSMRYPFFTLPIIPHYPLGNPIHLLNERVRSLETLSELLLVFLRQDMEVSCLLPGRRLLLPPSSWCSLPTGSFIQYTLSFLQAQTRSPGSQVASLIVF
jgi:hypothetical protein